MPLNRAQLRTLTLMKIVFPQVLENAANDLQMFGTCVFIKCFQVSARGMQRFPFLTCCHLHALCYLLICVCVCVHCACVALCDCSVQLFWRHVLIIKHRCHKHSHHTHAQTLALSCNKHLVVYPVNCWTRSSGQCCTVKRVCISLIYAWQKCFYISFHVEWSIFYGCGRSSFKIIIICNSLININNY